MSATIIVLIIISFAFIVANEANEGRILEDLAYRVIYKPLYSLFSESKYLPFYIHLGGRLLLSLFLIGLFHAIIFYFNPDKWIIILSSLFIVLIINLNELKDLYFISQKRRSFVVADVDFCRREFMHLMGYQGIKSYVIYFWNSQNLETGKDIQLKLNIYQYKQLKGKRKDLSYIELIKRKKKGLEYLVYYLPHTRLVLRFTKTQQR